MGLCASAESNSMFSQWLVIICISYLALDWSFYASVIYRMIYYCFSVLACAAGQVILDTTLSLQNSNSGQILSIMPIAVSMDERAEFEVRGFNLSGSTTR